MFMHLIFLWMKAGEVPWLNTTQKQQKREIYSSSSFPKQCQCPETWKTNFHLEISNEKRIKLKIPYKIIIEKDEEQDNVLIENKCIPERHAHRWNKNYNLLLQNELNDIKEMMLNMKEQRRIDEK